ncbi:MAG: carbohydrate porin [Proteobacteria bacterium]|nr:MAG: carbohydrate porin [Pseudomonadota bacterium]
MQGVRLIHLSLFFSLLSFFPSPALALTPEYHGYLRAGAGNNGVGGKQECYGNKGTPGNEFRLGNECGIYGELALSAPLLKDEGTEPYFMSLVRLGFTPPGNGLFERNVPGPRVSTTPPGATVPTNESAMAVLEAFVEGGRFGNSPLTYWIGKRFYRDVDVVINDWFYYGHMSGNGAGIGNIPLGGGKLATALLFETGDTFTNKGQNQKQFLDFRWQQIPISSRSSLNVWAAVGQAPGGSADGKDYVPRKGFVIGTRWRRTLWEGSHDLALIYGRGLLQNMEIYGPAALLAAPDNPVNPERYRVVSNWNVQPIPKLGLHAAATFEIWNPHVPGIDKSGRWWNIAARPIWFLTKHTQLALEAGHSVYYDRGEVNAAGGSVGPRHLTRITIAPQLAVDSTLWARPVLRAFYSYGFWNDANRAAVAERAPTFAGASSGHNIGVQTEVWF